MKTKAKVTLNKLYSLFFIILFSTSLLYAIEVDDLQIVPKVVLDTNGYGSDIALNPTDKTLHVAWARGGDLYYSFRNVVGNWSVPEKVPDGGIVLYGEDDHGNEGTCSTISVSPDGTVHLVYTERAGNVWYVKGKAGNWSAPVKISSSSSLKANFDMIEANGSLYVVWEEGVADYQYMCSNINGVWGAPKNLGRGEYTYLTKNNNGRVYFLGRSRDTIRNARFGYLDAGQTSMTWVSGATDAVVRLCDAPNVAVHNGKLYLAWGDVTGGDGPEKVELYCGAANEPGTTWNTKLGGSDPLYYENTGSPHPRVEVFKDGTVLFMNGRRMDTRFMIWNGSQWSATRQAPWLSGKPNLVSDGETVWVTTSELPGTEVSVSGISLPDPDISDNFQIIAKNIFDNGGFSGDIALNPLNGQVQSAWVHDGNIRFRMRTADGDWETVSTIPGNNLEVYGQDEYNLPQQCLAIDIDAQGVTHLAFTTNDGDVYYISGTPGNWSAPELVEDRQPFTLYPDIITVDNYIYIVYQDISGGAIRMAEKKNGAWQPAVAIGPGSYPSLSRGGNGLVYLVYRSASGQKNARFAYRVPGQTEWIFNDSITDAVDELGGSLAMTAGRDKIFLGWNNNSEQSGDFKSQIYCAVADEPGLTWTSKLGQVTPIYYENTSMPIIRTAVYSDDNLVLFNGRRKTPRFTVWDGLTWSKTRGLPWKEGYTQIVCDGRTAWVIASCISTQADEVSVTGIRNTDAAKYNFSNANPVITTNPDTLAAANTLWLYSCNATDDDDTPLTWSLVFHPTGMTMNAADGQVSWTPTAAHMTEDAWNKGAGVHLVGVKVKDTEGGYATQYFWLHVTETNHTPVITSTPVPQAFVDSLYQYQVTAEDQDGDAITFLLQQGPTGMSINSASGLLTWTPDDAQTGNQEITIKARDSKSAEDTQNFTITVTKIYTPPVAQFVADNTTGLAPFTVSFTDQSTGDITAWQWDFGDSTTSSLQNPQHTYTTPGVFTVTLSVTGPAGNMSIVKENYIQVFSSVLNANFSAYPVTGPAPLTVQFADSSHGDITTWQWDFGDSTGSAMQNPQHTFTLSGLYTVKLKISGPAGVDSLVEVDYINVLGTELVADFAAVPRQGLAPLTVQFSDSSQGEITSWLWDFGDSNQSTLQNPEHTFTEPGAYTIKLKITGPTGSDSLLRQDYINVYNAEMVPAFGAAPRTGIVPLTVQFSDSSQGDITAWEWDFGDSQTSALQNPEHTYTTTGSFTVRLKITGPAGTHSLIKENFLVVTLPPPVARFGAAPLEGSVPLSVQFADSSQGNITTWFWSFGDNTFTYNQNPQHIYFGEGLFTVSLVVSGPDGADTLTIPDMIHAHPFNGIQKDEALPTEFALLQNYPNPFNLQTTIEYQLPKNSRVSIRVYDINGKLVNVLQERQQSAGAYKLDWYGVDLGGQVCPSGVYIVQLKTNGFTAEKKVILLK